MTVKISMLFRSVLVGQMAFTRLRIYTGTQPGVPDSTITDTLLGTVTMAFAQTDDSLALAAGPYTALAVADGEAGWGRCFLDTTETMFFDVSVGEAATDCIIDDATLVAGDTISLASLNITFGGA